MVRSALHNVARNREQFIGWLVDCLRGLGDVAFVESPSLHLQVSLDVLMGGVRAGVTEPGLDGGLIRLRTEGES